jgi:hypothetical protein
MLSKILQMGKRYVALGLDPYLVLSCQCYVFDFFSKLTDANGFMLLMYANGPNDPHPNAAATALVAPQLVDEVFNHSIAYEQIFGIKKINEAVPENYMLGQNFPNPFNPSTKIQFSIPKAEEVLLSVYAINRKLYAMFCKRL